MGSEHRPIQRAGARGPTRRPPNRERSGYRRPESGLIAPACPSDGREMGTRTNRAVTNRPGGEGFVSEVSAMSVSRRPANRGGDETGRGHGPESVEPWGTTGGTEDRDPPWGAGEDSPLDEGSEPTGLPPGRRAERRAGAPTAGERAGGEEAGPWAPESGRHGFGTVEPSRVPEAGPGGPPDPAPSRRLYPEDTGLDDLGDNPLERETGMRPEGVARHE